MKKLLSIAFTFLAVSAFASGTIAIQANKDSTSILQYFIDTLESYQVGPGVIYTRFDISTGSGDPRHCYIYDIDLNNPYNSIEESHSETMGKTELMVTSHKRLDAPMHRSIGSVNCNFWAVTIDEGLLGVGMTGQVSNGRIGASITNWNIGRGETEEERKQEVGYLMVDNTKHAYIDQYSWQSQVRIGDAVYPISESNRNRNNPKANEIVLFNSDLGERPTLSHSDALEVVVAMVSPWSINQELTAVVESTNTTGATLIPEGKAVLRGRGTGYTFLQNVQPGDTIHFTIGIYTSLGEEYPAIEQLSAGNCLVMKDGRLTVRNWNEEYNNKNYPRTGFATNATHDRVWMMVMEKPGMYTHEMCSIFRYFGATEAMGADGGGSAQFNLRGKILNPTTEGSPRAVSNAVFVFSTAPEDSVPSRLVFWEKDKTDLASYADYTPQMIAYNQYGMLLSTDFTGYTLSCEPASLGTISADGRTFTASPIDGEGKLIATAGGVRTEKEICVHAGKLSLRLDKVIVDRTPYQVEVFSTMGDKKQPVHPSKLTWQIQNDSLCEIIDGSIIGLRNGTTEVYGTLGDYNDTLLVQVEISDEQHRIDGFTIDTIVSYSTTRNANVVITFDRALYGRPDSVLIRVCPTAALSSATVTLSAQDTKSHTISLDSDSVAANETHTYVLLPEQFSDTPQSASFPLVLEKMKFIWQDISKNVNYHLHVIDIICCYSTWGEVPVGLDNLISNGQEQKIMVDGHIYIIRDGHYFDALGRIIK